MARRSEAALIFHQIVQTVGDSVLEELESLYRQDPRITRQEIQSLAQLVADLEAGRVVLPRAEDFLEIRDEASRHESARNTLRGMVASIILQHGQVQPKTASLKHRLGRETGQLRFFLGVPQGREIIRRELEGLSNFERTLMYQSMSTNLKTELDYPDLEECGEEQMAEYIAGAAYHGWGIGESPQRAQTRSYEENFRRLEILITTAVERDGSGFWVSRVLDILHQRDYSSHMFRRIILAAEEKEFLDQAECFFQTHWATARWAAQCSQLLQGDAIRLSLEDVIDAYEET